MAEHLTMPRAVPITKKYPESPCTKDEKPSPGFSLGVVGVGYTGGGREAGNQKQLRVLRIPEEGLAAELGGEREPGRHCKGLENRGGDQGRNCSQRFCVWV